MEQNKGYDRRKCVLVIPPALCAMLVTGCAGLHLPRIDPSGERLFLPSPAYTTTVQPAFPFRGLGNRSGPAYRTPPDPPPCPLAVQAPTTPAVQGMGPAGPAMSPVPSFSSPPVVAFRPVATPLRRPVSGVWMNTERIVAPVGSQVVLRAGLYGENGRLLPGKPIEWILSQESVGHFISVGGENRPSRLFANSTTARKLSNSFAVGHTARTAQLMSRGTPRQDDDIRIHAGETWLALTSAREGISRVSVYAPEMKSHNTSEQTTTVHWVDASWAFPLPVTVPGGQSVNLSTTVTKPSNSGAAVGTVVRYEILDGANASFVPSGQRAIEVPVNMWGLALAQLQPNDKRAVTAQVAIHVIQPPANSSDFTRVILGQGSTSVTWDAPNLTVRARGPDVVDLDSALTLRIDVTNEGSNVANDVVVDGALPDGIEFLNSEPPAQIFGDRIQWRFAQLAAGANRAIELNYRAQRVGNYHYCLRARSTDGVEAEDTLEQRVVRPALQIEVSGPQTAKVGDQIQFRVVARNTSNQKMTNVIVYDRYDQGFAHAEAASPIKRSLGDIGPGEEKQFAITLTVAQPGLRCHDLELTANGGHENSERICLQAMPVQRQASPALTVSKTGPQSRTVGEEVDFLIRVINTGNVPLRNIRVLDVYPPSLRATMATRGYAQKEDGLEWTLSDLGVGQSASYEVRCKCQDVESRACSHVIVKCNDPQVSAVKESCLNIRDQHDEDGYSTEESTPLQPPLEAEATGEDPILEGGNLRLSLTDLGDPVRPGRTVTYLLRVTNERPVSDKKVRIRLQLSEHLDLVRFLGPPLEIAQKSSDGRRIDIQTIEELRPGESVDCRLEVMVCRPGQAVLSAEAVSLLTQQPLREEERTTIFVE